MACSASSPRLPSAARWKVSSVSRRQRATVALKSSFFVPKSRKTYGCEMPARRAISSVEAPCSPRDANSICAASRTASRRTSALCRVVVAMRAMLVVTHYLVKDGCHALDVALRDARVERQCERPLVATVGARERPLVAIRGEPVQRVGADLGLDPFLPERLERVVAPVELDDERLPAVAVALVRARELDQAVQPRRVRRRDSLALAEELLEPPQLRNADGAEDVGEPVVQAGARDLELAAAVDAVVSELANPLRELGLRRRHSAALARRDDLARVEREAAEPTQAAAGSIAPARAERSGGVLDEHDLLRYSGAQRLPVERPAEEVDGDHGAGPWRHRGVSPLRVEVHRPRIDVDEDGPGADLGDDVRGGGERVGGDEHLVARPEPQGQDGEVQRSRSGRDDERVLDGAGRREPSLELGHLRAHRELTALEHRGDLGRLLGAHVGAREPDHASAGFLCLYQAIVRARPSSSSTWASKPSSSRALSTFGMRISTSM